MTITKTRSARGLNNQRTINPMGHAIKPLLRQSDERPAAAAAPKRDKIPRYRSRKINKPKKKFALNAPRPKPIRLASCRRLNKQAETGIITNVVDNLNEKF